MSGYQLSLLAGADLESMLDFGARQFGAQQAIAYHDEICRVLNLIADHPKIARERPGYSKPIRIHHHGRHYIVYLVMDEGPLILRIVRDEMDLAAYLKRLG